jgi:hypothetical protein
MQIACSVSGKMKDMTMIYQFFYGPALQQKQWWGCVVWISDIL